MGKKYGEADWKYDSFKECSSNVKGGFGMKGFVKHNVGNVFSW